jgi:hypothetical protein
VQSEEVVFKKSADVVKGGSAGGAAPSHRVADALNRTGQYSRYQPAPDHSESDARFYNGCRRV